MNTRSPKNLSPKLGVIILGAGASSRMGQPKLLLPWGDTSIIGHLVRLWRKLQAAQIAVVCRPGDKNLGAELDRLRFPPSERIENPQPERGMFSSIQCAARWSGWKPELSTWALVLGDQPHLRLETLKTLLEFHNRNAADICQPEFEGHARHPVILARQAFDGLRKTRAETLKDFLKHFPGRSVQCRVDDAGLSVDLDTPEEYKQAAFTSAAHEKL